MKKKLMTVVLSAMLAVAAMGTATLASAETITSGTLVAAWTNGAILDSLKLDGTAYPTDHGIKFGKVGEVFTLVNNDNAVNNIGGGGYFANTALPLTKSLTADVKSYTASAEVKPVFKGNYGGAGIVFGMCDSKPMSFWVSETSAFIVSMGGEEYKFFPGASNTAEKAPFALDTAYTLKVVVSEGLISFYYNNALLEADMDYTAFAFTPAVGPAQNNYRAEYKNFSITVEEEALQLSDFADAENLVKDGMGLYDVYAIDQAAQQPYPQEWGIRVAKVGDAYTRTDNKMVPMASDNHGATFFGVSKDISEVSSYMVSAKVKPTKKNNWGGLGITIGKDLENGYPIVMWACLETAETDSPLGSINLGYDLNEWKTPVAANAFEPAVGTEFEMAAVINGKTVFAYIDGVYAGRADISVEFEPAVGIDFKNYQAEFKDITFKTLESGLQAAKYDVYFVSGGVELKKEAYTVGQEFNLAAIERNGYTFGGWKIMPDLSGATVTSVASGVAGDVFVYCEYKIKTFSIKYYDGQTEITDSGNDAAYDIRSFIDFKAVTKEGYKFLGWYDNAEFSGEAVTSIQIGSYGDKNLYAKFEAEKSADETKKGGCGSDITGTGSVMAIIGLVGALAGAVVILRARRKED